MEISSVLIQTTDFTHDTIDMLVLHVEMFLGVELKGITLKRIFYRIWITMEKIVRETSPTDTIGHKITW